jgi:hypothetical protein
VDVVIYNSVVLRRMASTKAAPPRSDAIRVREMKAQGLGPTEIAKTLSIGSGERLSCVGGRSLTRPQIRVCVPEAASIDRFGHDAVGGSHYFQGLPERTGVE